MKYRYLSHVLSEEIPVFGGRDSVDISRVRSISTGDSVNIDQFSMKSHCGTHIDAPNHFFERGKRIADYPSELWFFKSPHVLQMNLKPSETLLCDEWIENIHKNSDILLFQSGWTRFRREEIYGFQNPGVHRDVGLYLRKKYPNLKAIGIDWISISPYQNRPLGREAHRAFLDPEGKNNPILIIEDMDLSCNLTNLKEVFVFPLRIETLDSAPCTAIGGFLD